MNNPKINIQPLHSARSWRSIWNKEFTYIHMQTENNQILQLQWMPALERMERVFNSFSCSFRPWTIWNQCATLHKQFITRWAFSFVFKIYMYLLFVPWVWSLGAMFIVIGWLMNRIRAHSTNSKTEKLERRTIGGNNLLLFGDVFVCFGLIGMNLCEQCRIVKNGIKVFPLILFYCQQFLALNFAA